MKERCLLPIDLQDLEHLLTCDEAAIAKTIERIDTHPVGPFAVWLALQDHPQGQAIWSRIMQAKGRP